MQRETTHTDIFPCLQNPRRHEFNNSQILLVIITLASSTYGENSLGRTYIPAFFCRSQAFDFPPSDVGSMSEGGVLIRPLFIFKNEEKVSRFTK